MKDTMISFAKRNRLLSLAIIASFLAVIYYLLIAEDMYESKSSFIIDQQQSISSSDEIMNLIASASGGNSAMPHAVYTYITSYDMYDSLERELGIRDHYALRGLDFITSLSSGATQEELLDYWDWIVSIVFDQTTGIFELEVKAFDPDKAHEINMAILRKCEELINTINDKRSLDSMVQARTEVGIAEKRLLAAQSALQAFTEQYEDLDPESTATSRVTIIAQLEGQLAQAETELATAESFMREGSIALRSLESKITGIRRQIDEERSRLTDADNATFTQVIAEYESLMLEHEFARNQYTSALAAMEMARVQNDSSSGFLVTVQSPMLPDDSTYPDRPLFAFLSVVVIFMAYSLVALLIASIKEHGVFNA